MGMGCNLFIGGEVMGQFSDEYVLTLQQRLHDERQTVLRMKKEFDILGGVLGIEPPCVSTEVLMGIQDLQKKLEGK